MTVRTAAELKALFETKDQPTQQDFVDLIDSLLLTNENNFPNPLPAVDASALLNVGNALPDPLPAVSGKNLLDVTPSEWDALTTLTPAYSTSTSFVVSGELTDTFKPDRRIRLVIDGTNFDTDILSRSYNSGADITTVNLVDAMPTSNLTAVLVGFVSPTIYGGTVSPLTVGGKPRVKNHDVQGANYTINLNEAGIHIISFSANVTLTIASAFMEDKATVIVKSNGFTITLAGIDNDSPTLTAIASKQDIIEIVKSFTKTTATVSVLNRDSDAMLVTTWMNLTTFSDDFSVGYVGWSSPGNAVNSDDARASVIAPTLSAYLAATGLVNASTEVPVGATIFGVEFSIEKQKANTASCIDNSVKLIKAGTVSGDEKASANQWPQSSDAYSTYGAVSDLWGLSLSRADVIAANFGVGISANNYNLGNPLIDHIRGRVYYIP